MKNEKIPEKLVYRLEEISRITKLNPQVIDSWEKEFPLLNSGRTGAGHKIFRKNDLRIILRIKELLEKKGFTLAGAKRKIEEEFGTKTSSSVHPDQIKKTLFQVREQLKKISDLLEKDPKKK
ncbi:MAG: MerR family transcriptional regulator [Candidatus Aminicenantaceae bacterium]